MSESLLQRIRREANDLTRRAYEDILLSADEALALVDIAEASIEFSKNGFRNDGEHLIVTERKDNIDPHYKWCDAIEKLEVICQSR